jgi:hypothetical protein
MLTQLAAGPAASLGCSGAEEDAVDKLLRRTPLGIRSKKAGAFTYVLQPLNSIDHSARVSVYKIVNW